MRPPEPVVYWMCHRKGGCILEYAYFSKTGKYHRQRQGCNEDRVVCFQREDLVGAVVCDGAGSCPSGGLAAQLVSEAVAKALSRNFAGWYDMDAQTLRRRLVRCILDRLEHCRGTHGIPPKELACTLMAAVMDRQGRCLCVHLGDGIILTRRHDGFQVASAPENGLVPAATYLTMNCNMFRHLRLCRWQDPSVQALYLLTDGAANHLVHRGGNWQFKTEHLHSMEAMEKYLKQKEPWDDHSCAILRR